jgi:hypothetical protein
MTASTTDTTTTTRRGAGSTTSSQVRTVSTGTTIAVLAGWVAVIAVGHGLLERLQAAGANIRINAAPLDGTFQFRPSARVVPGVVAAALAVSAGPLLARRATWRTLMFGSAVAAAIWAVSLDVVDGWHALTGPLEKHTEYLADVARVDSLGAFLLGFVAHIRDYSVHVQGHPPGFLLILSGMDRIGLGGSGWAAALVIAGGAASVPAVLVAVRDVAGESVARQAAPFLVIAPAAIWVATSADALYMGVSAWAVALVVLATGRRGAGSDTYALAGGLLFGATAFLSYGLVLLAVVPSVVAWRRRRFRPIMVAMLGAAVVFAAFLAAGFSWVAGLVAARARYFAGVGGRRPYADFLVGNAAAFGLALGPAIVVALARLHDRRLWLLVGGGLMVVGLAMMSGMSKGEVERIWLPFALWLLPAGAVFVVGRDRATSGWLGLQAATAITVATAVKTAW